MSKDNFEEVINIFGNKDNPEQAEIVGFFYGHFMDDTKCMVSELLDKADKKFNLGCTGFFAGINDFDVSNKNEEDTINHLFEKFPDNNSYPEVLAKVIVVNQLYSTRLNDNNAGNKISVKEMAHHIIEKRKDIEEAKLSPDNELKIKELVSKLGDKENYKLDRSVKCAYSFASKYLSFTFREFNSVPITDTYARNTLQLMDFAGKKSNLDFYPNYYDSVRYLRNMYGNKVGYKEIDAFLWIMGKAYTEA